MVRPRLRCLSLKNLTQAVRTQLQQPSPVDTWGQHDVGEASVVDGCDPGDDVRVGPQVDWLDVLAISAFIEQVFAFCEKLKSTKWSPQ